MRPGLNRGGDWREGRSSWTTDYPRRDRHFAQAMRRLTRVNARSVEQPVNLDWGEEYDWPFLYAVEVGHWQLTDEQVKSMREYLLRGGFFMCDDFHGTQEWEVFLESMHKFFPDRPTVDLENQDAVFHTIYDFDDRYQVPGAQYLRSGQTWEKEGYKAVWRGIYDDKNRLMVAIVHNSDLADCWEHAEKRQIQAGVFGPRHSHRNQLRRLFHDPLAVSKKLCLGTEPIDHEQVDWCLVSRLPNRRGSAPL